MSKFNSASGLARELSEIADISGSVFYSYVNQLRKMKKK